MVTAIREVARRGRRQRRPQHRFNLQTMPYTIQPMLLAPVLPGETMDQLLLQARVVSDPVKNPLIGWWKEYYFFYVKHRDLEQIDGFAEAFQDMMLDPTWSKDAYDDATQSWPYYHAAGCINWSKLCLQRVVEEYFRNEGEAWNVAADANGLPRAGINNEGWWQSMLLDQTVIAADDVDVDENADDTITYGEINRAQQQWLLLQQNNLIDMSYEDYLSTFGVRVPKETLHVPELLRYVKAWQYPSNSVDPTDGSVSSALSWSIAERADKPRFCKEPGFLFGVTVTRPKVYMGGLSGSAAGVMDNAIAWLPAVLRGEQNVSMLKQGHGTGPATYPGNAQLPGPANDDYWFDIRDLLIYGDQFVNYAMLTGHTGNSVDLPEADAQRRYAATADIQYLFSSANYNIREDGVINLAIASAETKDLTPATPNVTV